MKINVLFGMFLLWSVVCWGQGENLEVYHRPLKNVLSEIESRYEVKIICSKKYVKGKVVTYAPWKFYDEVEETLENVLRPLEMRYTRKGEGVYEVRNWQYFQKPFSEGEKHLERLLQAYPTPEAWEIRKAGLQKHILQVLGLEGMPKGDLKPIRSNFRRHDGYSVENVALEILPGVWVCGSLYMPLKQKGKIPAFLCPHGHFYATPKDEPGRYRSEQQIRCAMLARMGVAVFSYDMFAWGESALAFEPKDHRTDLGLRIQIWQGIRVLDYLSGLPGVDKSRIGITAASGGASQAMLLTAIDDRITLSVPTVMMASHFFGGCPCESGLPIHLPEGTFPSNNAEFAAMAAPRPQLVISDGSDWTQTTPVIEFPYLQKIYGYYGAESSVKNVHLPQDKHDYGYHKRIALYDFVAEYFHLQSEGLKDRQGNYDESSVVIEPSSAMLVFGKPGNLPEGAVKGATQLRRLLEHFNL